jgi:hypothetical protein
MQKDVARMTAFSSADTVRRFSMTFPQAVTMEREG